MKPTFRLLIAEPDRLQLQLIDMLLATGEYDATMVETGREALEHLKVASPDLCIFALDLPDVAGDVICGKVRRVSRLARTPVILIAPQAGRFGLSDQARARARKVGADLVLPRPLGDKNLRERVQGLLDARDETPTREGFTTQIIEEALGDLDAVPDSEAGSRTDADAAGDAGRQRAAPTDGASDAGNTAAQRAAGDPARETGRAGGDASALDAPDGAMHDRDASSDPTPMQPRFRSAAGARRAGDGSDAAHYGALKNELEAVRMENAQLRRKINEKNAALEAGVNPKMQRTIDELERRNQALLDAIEALKDGRDDGRGGGLFGRRK